MMLLSLAAADASPAAPPVCPPGSCGAPECVECCHRGRCCKRVHPSPAPCPAQPRPPHSPPSPPPTAQCLLPFANGANAHTHCCKPGSKDGGACLRNAVYFIIVYLLLLSYPPCRRASAHQADSTGRATRPVSARATPSATCRCHTRPASTMCSRA
eukprot:SAG31_NODE_54_length_29987_cov_4.570664_21_plen_156_part_00